MFEVFIRNSRTDRYNQMCSITEHNRPKPTYVDGSINAGDRAIPKNATTAALNQ